MPTYVQASRPFVYGPLMHYFRAYLDPGQRASERAIVIS